MHSNILYLYGDVMLMQGLREWTGPYRVRHYYEMEPRFYSFIRMIATFIDMVHLFAFLLQQAREF